MNSENDLQELLNETHRKENKSKWSITWVSALPVIIAVIFLYYTFNQIRAAEMELEEVDLEISMMKIKNDSLEQSNQKLILDNIILDSIKNEYRSSNNTLSIENEKLLKRYNKLNVLYKSYEWSPDFLKGEDSLIIKEAIKANDEILKILDSNHKLNYNITIRYYAKKLDNEKAKRALRRTGYRDLLYDNDSWDSEILSNSLSFDNLVSLDDVKFIALSLIREGIELKQITFYTSETLRTRRKSSTMEIWGNENENESKSITVDSLLILKKENIINLKL